MEKIKLIAETAWHHDGDFAFMQKLVNEILKKLDRPQTILQRKNGDIVLSELSGNIYIVSNFK